MILESIRCDVDHSECVQNIHIMKFVSSVMKTVHVSPFVEIGCKIERHRFLSRFFKIVHILIAKVCDLLLRREKIYYTYFSILARK
jgi:hypothetical protein